MKFSILNAELYLYIFSRLEVNDISLVRNYKSEIIPPSTTNCAPVE